MHPDLGLDAAYRARLGIAPSDPLPPDGNTLRRLVELHLRRIPFENLSLHGAGDGAAAADDDAADADADEPPIPLSLPLLRDKILLRKRGGCCLELNGLLGHYLLELGYPVVRLVPGWVCAGPERGHGRSGGGHGGHGSHSRQRRRQRAKFRTRQTHAFLLVRTRPPSAATSGADADGKRIGKSYLVDVGLGEPPLRPLEYGPAALGAPQLSPDGMRSRIVREGRAWTDGRGRARRCLRMEWWRPCRGCFERRQDRGGGGGKGSDDSAAEAGAAEAVAVEAVPRLGTEARRLRSQADRARRKAAARPRPPFKVYASDASVREEARRRWVGRVRSNGAEASAPAPDAGTTTTGSSKNDAGENERIRREICDMWATLPRDGREQYQHVALAEVADLREKARAALEKAEHAEALLREAATRRKSVASAKSTDRCSSSIWRCDEQCTGEGGYWEPRIQWDVSDAPLEPTEGEPSFVDDRPLESFADAAAIVASEGSTFRSKIVVCALTRSEKITLAGNHLRITRPRFPPCSLRRQGDGDGDDEDKNRWPVQTRKHLSSKEDILAALADCFDLDSKQLSDLNVGDPSSSPLSGNECRLWEHL